MGEESPIKLLDVMVDVLLSIIGALLLTYALRWIQGKTLMGDADFIKDWINGTIGGGSVLFVMKYGQATIIRW